MIGDKELLGIVMARGGSKGLPRKNICDLAGKPLIAWTIEAGLKSKYLDRLILSSEDGEIMGVAEAYGCDVPFRRPDELAEDETSSIDVLLHALQKISGYNYVVLLQPTSPLRTAEDIDACIERIHDSGAPACVSVTSTPKPPQWMYTLRDDSRLTPVLPDEGRVTRRQDAPPTYVLNGAIYVADARWLVQHKSFMHDETVAYVMPTERSIDIDNKVDMRAAKAAIENT